MMTKFKADYQLNTITPIQIERETSTRVYFSGISEPKTAGIAEYYNTYDEAKKGLLNKASNYVDFYSQMLKNEVDKLNKILEL